MPIWTIGLKAGKGMGGVVNFPSGDRVPRGDGLNASANPKD